MSKGIFIIAIGDKAKQAANHLSKHIDMPYFIATRRPAGDYSDMVCSRIIKTEIALRSPFDETLYLDADTLPINPDYVKLFKPLQNSFDLVITPSTSQNFWHIGKDELLDFTEGNYHPLQLQCGVFAFRKSDRVLALFEYWQQEYIRYQNQDQLAFVRALHRSPVRLFLFSRHFNNGTVIRHNFGLTRKK